MAERYTANSYGKGHVGYSDTVDGALHLLKINDPYGAGYVFDTRLHCTVVEVARKRAAEIEAFLDALPDDGSSACWAVRWALMAAKVATLHESEEIDDVLRENLAHCRDALERHLAMEGGA